MSSNSYIIDNNSNTSGWTTVRSRNLIRSASQSPVFNENPGPNETKSTPNETNPVLNGNKPIV